MYANSTIGKKVLYYIGLFDTKTELNSNNNSLYNSKSTKGALQLNALNVQQYNPHFVIFFIGNRTDILIEDHSVWIKHEHESVTS